MSKHFNELSPAEAERLALLAEECAEVVQIIGKILRHGYASHHPDYVPEHTNAVMLAEEVGHVNAAIELLLCAGDVEGLIVSQSRESKTSVYRAKKYLHHQ